MKQPISAISGGFECSSMASRWTRWIDAREECSTCPSCQSGHSKKSSSSRARRNFASICERSAAGGPSFTESGQKPSSLIVGLPTTDTSKIVDTTTTRNQYLLTGGVSRWGLRLSATGRARNIGGKSYMSPSARAVFDRPRLTVSFYGERQAQDSVTRTDIGAQFTPFSFLSLAGYASRETPDAAKRSPPMTAVREEAGLRIGRAWLSAGLVVRDTTETPPPVVF